MDENKINEMSDKELIQLAQGTESKDVLESIFQKTESDDVLKALAENPNADADLLSRIVDYSDSSEVAIAASNNENSTVELNGEIIEKFGQFREEEISGNLREFYTDEQVQQFKDIMNEEQASIKESLMDNLRSDLEKQFGEGWESLEATGKLDSAYGNGVSVHDENNTITLGEIVDRFEEIHVENGFDYINNNAHIDNDAISLKMDSMGEPLFLKNADEDSMREFIKDYTEPLKDMVETTNIESVFVPYGESLSDNIAQNNIDYAEKTVEYETQKAEQYVEKEGSKLSPDEEKLRALEKEDNRTLSDAIDIYIDGKFDNDSGDRMGNRDKHEQSMKM